MDFRGTQEATICHLLEGDPSAGGGRDRPGAPLAEKARDRLGTLQRARRKGRTGQAPRECAIREAREELRIEVHDLGKIGELGFAFGGEPTFFCHVYRSASFSGQPQETPEAKPAWFPVDDLPYDQMWEDDRHWFPLLLDDQPFRGLVAFDAAGEEMETCELNTGISLERAVRRM